MVKWRASECTQKQLENTIGWVLTQDSILISYLTCFFLLSLFVHVSQPRENLAKCSVTDDPICTPVSAKSGTVRCLINTFQQKHKREGGPNSTVQISCPVKIHYSHTNTWMCKFPLYICTFHMGTNVKMVWIKTLYKDKLFLIVRAWRNFKVIMCIFHFFYYILDWTIFTLFYKMYCNHPFISPTIIPIITSTVTCRQIVHCKKWDTWEKEHACVHSLQ